MVPMLQCGFVRSNLALAIFASSSLGMSSFGFWAAPPGAARPLATNFALRQLRLHLVGDVLRHFLVMGELHGVLRAPLSEAAQLVDVTEHVGERHHGLDRLGIAAGVGALDLAAPAVQ